MQETACFYIAYIPKVSPKLPSNLTIVVYAIYQIQGCLITTMFNALKWLEMLGNILIFYLFCMQGLLEGVFGVSPPCVSPSYKYYLIMI